MNVQDGGETEELAQRCKHPDCGCDWPCEVGLEDDDSESPEELATVLDGLYWNGDIPAKAASALRAQAQEIAGLKAALSTHHLTKIALRLEAERDAAEAQADELGKKWHAARGDVRELIARAELHAKDLAEFRERMHAAEARVETLRGLLEECWPYLFDDDGSAISPEELRERVQEVRHGRA